MFSDENIHTRIWPRAAALGDKLWSPNTPLDLIALVKRLNALSAKLNAKGIPTSSITNEWCEIHPDVCFKYHNPTS